MFNSIFLLLISTSLAFHNSKLKITCNLILGIGANPWVTHYLKQADLANLPLGVTFSLVQFSLAAFLKRHFHDCVAI